MDTHTPINHSDAYLAAHAYLRSRCGQGTLTDLYAYLYNSGFDKHACAEAVLTAQMDGTLVSVVRNGVTVVSLH
jgi:hypothetical protein